MRRLNESRIAALLTEPYGAAFLQSASSRLHVEHGVSVLIALDSDVQIGRITGRVVVVPPDVPHAAHAPGPVVSYAFDPELCPRVAAFAREGHVRAMDGRLGSRLSEVVAAARGALSDPEVLRGAGAEVARILSLARPRPIDRRVARAVEVLRDPEADRAEVIASSRLSGAHLRALFVRDVGVPVRRYVLWRRLLHALARVGPLDLTAAAHAGGFSDLAHFSRTCRRLLGYSPGGLRDGLAAMGPI